MSSIPPIRRQILVDADPATAFEVFTARIGRWWPLVELSVSGAGATVAFEDGQLVERSADGAVALWGTVTRWEPPGAVAFSWHPGQPADRASHVEVTFAAAGGQAAGGQAAGGQAAGGQAAGGQRAGEQTLVTLEHTGWDVFSDPAAARAEYDQGWSLVLERYGSTAAAGGEDDETETWVALLHRPGPDAPAAGSLFEDPRFAQHLAFLSRMLEAGYLVAAGPLADADGDGMTILRLPGADQLGEAARLATEEDKSVAGGLLAVTVRPWQVVMRGGAWAGQPLAAGSA